MRIVSYAILGIIILIFFTHMNMYNTENETVNYFLRSFYHANIQHLIANSISFYGLSFIEDIIGTNQFIICMLFLWSMSSFLLYVYHEIFPSRKIVTVGFSAVIFGLMVVYYSLMNIDTSIAMTKLFAIILPQLMVPQISAEGHICGVIAGFIYVHIMPINKNF